MFIPPGQGNAAHPTRSRRSSSSSRARCWSSSRTAPATARRRCWGRGTASRCPANVIHGFTNVGLEPAYLQVMLGKAKPELMTYTDGDLQQPPRRAPPRRGLPRLAFRSPLPRACRRLPKRKEDGRFVAGQGRYLDDLRVPGLLHVALVRSPHAHARVVADRRGAPRAPDRRGGGVDARRPAGAGRRERPPARARSRRAGAYVHPIMAGGRARHVGESVAVVVADDPYVAADGAERVRWPTSPARRRRRARPPRPGPRASTTRGRTTSSRRARAPRAMSSARWPTADVVVVRAAGLPARGRDADRDARRAGAPDRDRRRPHGVDVDPGALRGAQRDRAGGGPARGANPGDRPRRGRRLRGERARLPRGDPAARGGPSPRAAR